MYVSFSNSQSHYSEAVMQSLAQRQFDMWPNTFWKYNTTLENLNYCVNNYTCVDYVCKQ